MKRPAFLLASLSALTLVDAFLPLSSITFSFSSRLLASNDDYDKYESALAHNMARTDVKNFLTQRAIQSFVYLLNSCRDPHTVTWMEEFGGWENLENYHGTGAFNMTRFGTWDAVLHEMMTQPVDVVIVRAKRRGRGHGGWSKDNPYLEERFVEFKIDIDPVSLASRIISVREQLAAEWTRDLDTLISANNMILQSYHDKVMNARDEEVEYDRNAQEDDEDGQHFDRDDLTAPYSKVAFDRNAMMLLRNSMSFSATASSPLRNGNFDLMILLATQESLHRVLREYKAGGETSAVAFAWLREFYTERVKHFFDGNQEHGRADDFLDELLWTPPSVKNVGRKVELIDPLRIAEDIIRMRTSVALDWKAIVANVPKDHTQLRKALLARQMLKWGQRPEAATHSEIVEGGDFE